MSTRDFWYMWLSCTSAENFCADKIALAFALYRHCEEIGALRGVDVVLFLQEIEETFDDSELLFNMSRIYISKQMGDKKAATEWLMEQIKLGSWISRETPQWWFLLDNLGGYWDNKNDIFEISRTLFLGDNFEGNAQRVALEILETIKEELTNNSNN